jgi:hypothetical protein
VGPPRSLTRTVINQAGNDQHDRNDQDAEDECTRQAMQQSNDRPLAILPMGAGPSAPGVLCRRSGKGSRVR